MALSFAARTDAPLMLHAHTASDLMAPNPISIRAEAGITEAMTLFTEKGIHAAPVIDEAGHHLGVVSRSDILRYDRERAWLPPPAEPPRARGLMTPAVFSVKLDISAARVAEHMVELNVHRLFVVDDDGILVGVITALDLLRHLCGQLPAG